MSLDSNNNASDKVGAIHTIHPDGTKTTGSSVAMTGHTIIQAESIEEAVAIAKGCPFLETNGTLEVAEIVHMSR